MLLTLLQALEQHFVDKGYTLAHDSLEHHGVCTGLHITHSAHQNLHLSIYPLGPKDTTHISLSVRDSDWERPHLAHKLIDLAEPHSINQLEVFLQQHIPCPTS